MHIKYHGPYTGSDVPLDPQHNYFLLYEILIDTFLSLGVSSFCTYMSF